MRLISQPVQRPETYSKADVDPRTGKPLDVGISGQEKHGNAKDTDGFFQKGILKALETDHTGKGNALEVKVVANGHCHRIGFFRFLMSWPADSWMSVTENCRRVSGVWLCFGGGG